MEEEEPARASHEEVGTTRSCRLPTVTAADSSVVAVFIFLYRSHQDGCRCGKLFAVYSLKTELAEQKLYICTAVLVVRYTEKIQQRCV